MPRVSIIVPVYNKSAYLDECLGSLLSQTLGDIEVVCVDDGSTDGSDRQLAAWAQRDPRVRVATQPNAGPCVARNRGMAMATGDVLMFVDADDALVPDACEFVSSVFAEKNCEVLTFGFKIVPPEATHPAIADQLYPRDVTFDSFDPAILFAEKARPFAARTAVSRAFCERESIRWEPGLTLGDDQFFHFEIYPRSRRTTLSSRQLYLYRMAEGSITHAGFDGEERLVAKIGKHVDCEEAILRDWQEAGLMGLCPAPLLEWCLELLLNDVSKLPPERGSEVWRDFAGRVASRFDLAATRPLLARPTRRCLDDVLAVAEGRSVAVPFAHVASFYLARRGLAATLRRVAYGVTHRG